MSQMTHCTYFTPNDLAFLFFLYIASNDTHRYTSPNLSLKSNASPEGVNRTLVARLIIALFPFPSTAILCIDQGEADLPMMNHSPSGCIVHPDRFIICNDGKGVCCGIECGSIDDVRGKGCV